MPPPFRRNWWLSSQKKMKPDSGSLIGFRHCPSIKPVHPDKPSFWPRIQDLYLIKMHYRTCFSSEGCQKRSPPNVRRVHQPTWIRKCFYCTSVISYFKLFISVDSWLIPNVNELKSLTNQKYDKQAFFSVFLSSTLNMFQSWITSFDNAIVLHPIIRCLKICHLQSQITQGW